MAPGTFLAAYHANRAQANEATLEASVLAGYIQQIVEAQQGDWTGTFADLLRQLVSMASEKDTKDKAWPTHANVLSSRMRALAPNLRAAGIEVTQSDKDSPRRNGLKRWVRIHIIEVDPDKNNGEKDRPHRPHRPPEHESGEKSGQSEDAGASASSASSSTQNTVNSCSQSMPPDDEDDMDAEFSDYSSDPTYQTSELSETPRTSDGEDDEDVLLI
jgi:hypothetical protein